MTTAASAMKNISILIIDDDEEDFIILRRYINQIKGNTTFTLDWCEHYQEGLDAICRGKHAIYFVDFKLGQKTGLDLIQESVSNNCEQPIVLLTGAGNQDIDRQAMQAGAADYLIKSELTTEKLERCIRYAVARHEFLYVLKENEQKYRGIFEKTKDFIFIAGESLAFLEVNQVGTALFGYSREEFSSMRLPDLLLYESDGKLIKETLEQSGELNDMEIELRAKNFQVINCVLSLSAEKNALGAYYFQGIIHDITALKNAEKANLQTTRLKATERLVRILAHEVRNPLNNILLAIDQLENIEEKDKIYLDIVSRNSNRINNLITELLYASRPSVTELSETTLESVLEKSIATATDRLLLKKVSIEKDYRAPSAFIMADPEKLSMAFLNIIINGIEASPAEHAKMTISLLEDRAHYTVSIADNGHGIDEENLSRLFEPYFTSKSAGMGLGLSSALSIFESHKALVQVKSARGAGTTFHVIFKK
ncbi:MAG: ATP-binding protein [Chitinophagaceae bacterium]